MLFHLYFVVLREFCLGVVT